MLTSFQVQNYLNGSQLPLTAALRNPAQTYSHLLRKEPAAITSKPPIHKHLPLSSQKLQGRKLTAQGLSICLTSGFQTAMNLQSQANTGTGVMVHSTLHCAVHSCTATTSVAHCRMPRAAILSSSDSEGDAVTASWKHNQEDSKPKQQQVRGKSSLLMPMSRLSRAFVHSLFLHAELLLAA